MSRKRALISFLIARATISHTTTPLATSFIPESGESDANGRRVRKEKEREMRFEKTGPEDDSMYWRTIPRKRVLMPSEWRKRMREKLCSVPFSTS